MLAAIFMPSFHYYAISLLLPSSPSFVMRAFADAATRAPAMTFGDASIASRAASILAIKMPLKRRVKSHNTGCLRGRRHYHWSYDTVGSAISAIFATLCFTDITIILYFLICQEGLDFSIAATRRPRPPHSRRRRRQASRRWPLISSRASFSALRIAPTVSTARRHYRWIFGLFYPFLIELVARAIFFGRRWLRNICLRDVHFDFKY